MSPPSCEGEPCSHPRTADIARGLWWHGLALLPLFQRSVLICGRKGQAANRSRWDTSRRPVEGRLLRRAQDRLSMLATEVSSATGLAGWQLYTIQQGPDASSPGT